MTDHELPPITDQASLEHAWRTLMGELGFAQPQLWLMFLRTGPRRAGASTGDDAPRLLKIEGVPASPSADDLRGLADILAGVLDETRECAFLLARPGHAGLTPGDLAWARGLGALPGRAWPVHVANDAELRVVAPDDLARAG